MGLLDGLFGKKSSGVEERKKVLPWTQLNTVDQLGDIIEKSAQKPQIIFKHSTTCGISRMVLQMFGNDYDLNDEEADLYFLDLHAFREVSNEVAKKFQVLHQSPQLLVIKKGVVVAHESHGAISEINLNNYV